MSNIMELPRGERLISLYQYFPRGEQNAVSIRPYPIAEASKHEVANHQ